MLCAKAIAIVIFTLFPLATTQSTTSLLQAPGVAVDPNLTSTLKKDFTLRVLTPDSKGRYDIGVTDSVRPIGTQLGDISAFSPGVGLANSEGPVFSLKDNKLITNNIVATIVKEDVVSGGLGLRSFIYIFFPPDPSGGSFLRDPFLALNFTAVTARDSYGKRYLRLGRGDGKFRR